MTKTSTVSTVLLHGGAIARLYVDRIKDPASSTLPEILVQALQRIMKLKETDHEAATRTYLLSLNGMLGLTPAVTLTPLMKLTHTVSLSLSHLIV